jgi:hypothetical protein
MDVVYVTIAVVIYARFSVRLGLISPELIANVLVVNVGAIIEDSDDDRPDRLAITPRERACYIVNPPEVASAIRAVVRICVVD